MSTLTINNAEKPFTPIVYSFQYSPDGVNSWDDFTITIA